MNINTCFNTKSIKHYRLGILEFLPQKSNCFAGAIIWNKLVLTSIAYILCEVPSNHLGRATCGFSVTVSPRIIGPSNGRVGTGSPNNQFWWARTLTKQQKILQNFPQSHFAPFLQFYTPSIVMALSVAVVVTTDGWVTAAWKAVSIAPKASSSPESEVSLLDIFFFKNLP